ncbi:MHC class I-like protein MILL2 [Peromyscus maniculatus bairdii]|uniref:MHC class I-like protein MILL2 n=1 Tax=Peromyscus maniculatus bairdii TaxID=230844 RepID=UPI00042AA163|nr:MHC class I-like protein MILL2 isoform X1 [Peromyscus maniculatus bairdii]
MIKLGNSWLFVQDKITRPVEVALFRNAIILAQLLLLCLLEVLVSCDGTHTLHYNLMALSLEGTRKFEFRAQGYIDNEPFLRYEGYRRRAELWGPRIKRQGGAEIWTRETKDMQEKEEQLRRMLTEVMTQKGQHGGIHTLQATFGCETQGNNTGGFWRLGYDGQDFLTFDQKSQTWKVSMPSALSTKTFWEKHGPSTDQVQTFLNDTCPDRLQRYSIYLGNQLMDTGPPMVTVSRRPYPVGRITLTCWAFNLYTPVATLTWLQDGRPVQQHSFGPGTILPSGNGTFQTWVSIWVLPGQEPHFTCRLRHRSKNIDVPTLLGPQAGESGGATSSASARVASAFLSMLVFLACA